MTKKQYFFDPQTNIRGPKKIQKIHEKSEKIRVGSRDP